MVPRWPTCTRQPLSTRKPALQCLNDPGDLTLISEKTLETGEGPKCDMERIRGVTPEDRTCRKKIATKTEVGKNAIVVVVPKKEGRRRARLSVAESLDDQGGGATSNVAVSRYVTLLEGTLSLIIDFHVCSVFS